MCSCVHLNHGPKDNGASSTGGLAVYVAEKPPREWRLGQLQTSQANQSK
jgi:hypothetical protein